MGNEWKPDTYPAGHRIDGPDGKYYVLTRELTFGQQMSMDLFRAGGGAPKPARGVNMPDFLIDWVQEHCA